MLDRFTEKLIESAVSSYMPRLQEMSAGRLDELARIKAKVRSEPSEVEEWFDREMAKARDMDINGVLKKIK
ncbi:hypothetical protein [Candidatus Nitrososphaera sp. FF02]|uniref:hypothetical protein n=1 Tax=Candidatus Nitrososphaera sp. FF02 TaxID=3398226 RepID=UPI0039ED2F67